MKKTMIILSIAILIFTLILIIPFWIYLSNNIITPKSHCNNNIQSGIIISIEQVQTGTILTLEDKGTIKKEVVENYYYTLYQVNDSIIHCK